MSDSDQWEEKSIASEDEHVKPHDPVESSDDNGDDPGSDDDVKVDEDERKSDEHDDEDVERAGSKLAPTEPPPPPNGGYGWVITGCCLLINVHTFGINATYGVFLAHYLQDNTFPGATSLDYAFVGGLSISCSFLVSPLATLITRYWGIKATLAIGVLFETVSLIGASFASQIWQLFLSQGICLGIGMGFLYIGSVGVLSSWFTTRRSLANGIAASGSGIGGLVYSLATERMIQTIGMGWAFRVLGILACIVTTICTLLIRDRNKLMGATSSMFDYRLFRRIEYQLLCVFSWFSMLGYIVLLFSLGNYANKIGLSSKQASLVTALLNLGQAIGRPPIGYFSDSIGRINMSALLSLLCGLFAFVIWIFAKNFGVLVFYAIVAGTVAGTFWATISPLSAEITGIRRTPSALNVIWIVIVLPCTFSEVIGLEIVDRTQSYLGTQLLTGFMYVAAAFTLVLVRGWKIGEQEAITRIKNEMADHPDAVYDEEEIAERARIEARRVILVHCWKWRKV